MKFSTVFFEEGSERMKGLKTIDLRSKQLGDVVALVGRNGSGKSRFLELIENFPHQKHIEDILLNTIANFPPNNTITLSTLETFAKQYQRSKKNEGNILNNLRQTVFPQYKQIASSYIKKINTDVFTQITKTNTPISLENLFKSNTANNDFDLLLTDKTLLYFQQLSDELNLERYNSSIEDDGNDNLENKISYKNFEKLKFYIEKFVGKKLSTRAKKINVGEVFSSSILLNGQQFKPDFFSPGEKILFAYAILFYLMDINSKNGLENCVLILDEPENHLHPSAQIQVISTIKDIVKGKGQLWLATHSLPLISSLEYDEIFLVKQNTILPPNRYNPGNSIIELMESEDNSYRMNQFLNSASDWAYSNFMIQCFLNPDVHLHASKGDKQICLFTNIVKSKEKLAILDYGAGKGRLAKVLAEDESLKSKIEYYAALEPISEHSEELRKIPFIKEIFSDEKSLPKNFFDIVLLFNVLHEINPEEWVRIFENIKDSLRDDGLLLIVEDKFLPKGEKINKYGYLILNELQILDLFSIDHSDVGLYNQLSNSEDKRITFSTIPKNKISISNESILKAITNLNKEVFGKMEEMRSSTNDIASKKDLSKGRIYAHYSQLFINTTIALKYLPDELSIKLTKTITDPVTNNKIINN